MSVVSNNILAGASGQGGSGYQIERSLRFNSADSAYLNRTPSAAGNRKTFTFSCWVKRSALGGAAEQTIFSEAQSTGNDPRATIRFTTNDAFEVGFNPTGSSWSFLTSTAVFRDVSAWYHFVIAVDTTQATAANRTKAYVNGTQITTWSTENYVAQDTSLPINLTQPHAIGRYEASPAAAGHYFNGYLADVHFIDGQALAPTDFGETDDNGVWQPKKYSGTYGTNGFHLDFKDNSSSSALGNDAAGSNNWTVNNLSVINGNGNYTSTVTHSGTQHGDASNIFDGNTATASGIQNGTVTYTPSPSTSVSSTIKFWYTTGQSNTRFKVNGGSYITLPQPSGVGTYTHSFSGTLSSIEWNAPSNGELVSVHQIQLDNVVLANYSAGSGNDSLRDSPSQIADQTDSGIGGEIVGNYATLNPLSKSSQTNIVLANGNLEASNTSSSGQGRVHGTIAISSGKWYFEATVTGSSNFHEVGIIKTTENLSYGIGFYAGGYSYNQPGTKYNNNATPSYGASYTTGDTIGVAFDADNGTLIFYKNGASQGTAFTGLSGTFYPAVSTYSSAANFGWKVNFGQRPFAYTAPSGFKALCTANLPDPTIADGSTAMDVALYTGNGSTQTISGLNFSPDFVWLKARSAATAHLLFDQIRGATYYLSSNATDAESNSPSNTLTAFNSDGFDLGANGSTNGSSVSLAAWTWDGGTSTVSNTDGSITSQVRANASAGFSIVKFTGVASPSGETVGHGLNAPVQLYFLKGLSNSTDSWIVGGGSAVGFSSGQFLRLNTTDAKGTTTANAVGVPNSSTVYVDVRNYSGQETIAYCFAPVEGYSAMGSYTGNGSADGPFVYTGFRPKFFMVKASSTTGPWIIYDSKRPGYNPELDTLSPNSSAAEDSSGGTTNDIVSNGFKIRGLDDRNVSGVTYIYAAFAEHPFKTSRAR